MFYELAKEMRDIIEQSVIKNETRCVTSLYNDLRLSSFAYCKKMTIYDGELWWS